jgi:predicted metal-binding membrane protein
MHVTPSRPTRPASLSPTKGRPLAGIRRIRLALSLPAQSNRPPDSETALPAQSNRPPGSETPQPVAARWPGAAAWYLALFLLIAAAWAVTTQQARHMGSAAAGTMGVGTAVFVGLWLAMVVAMMFPTVGPTAVIWSRRAGMPADGGGRRAARIVTFLAVYVLIWAVFGLLLYAAAAGLTTIAHVSAQDSRWIAVAVYAVAGVYQFTPAKTSCRVRCTSTECESAYLTARGDRRAILGVSVGHALACIGCCWAFMLVLTAVGLMNLLAMALLTVLIFVERRFIAFGAVISRLAGGLLLLAAALSPFVSWLHPGIWGGSGMAM